MTICTGPNKFTTLITVTGTQDVSSVAQDGVITLPDLKDVVKRYDHISVVQCSLTYAGLCGVVWLGFGATQWSNASMNMSQW